MQNVKAVPLLCDNAIAFGNLTCLAKHRRAISPRQSPHANDDHWPFGFFQFGGKFMASIGKRIQNCRILTKEKCIISQIDLWPNNRDRHPARQPVAADTRIQNGRFNAGIAANNQQSVSIINASDCRIEQIASAVPANFGTILTAIKIWTAKACHQAFQRIK